MPCTRLASLALLIFSSAGCSPSVGQVMADGEKASQPIINALAQFRVRHGRYPNELHEILDGGLLAEIPSVPDVKGREKRSIQYEANHDLDFYLLSFAYDIPESFGPGSIVRDLYISDEDKWQAGKFGPSMSDLVAIRAGKRFRETRSSKDLHLCVTNLIASAKLPPNECVNLWKSHITKALGEGMEDELNGEKGVRYQGEDGAIKYFFVFTNKLLPNPPHGEQAFVVAKRVFISSEKTGGEWLPTVECR